MKELERIADELENDVLFYELGERSCALHDMLDDGIKLLDGVADSYDKERLMRALGIVTTNIILADSRNHTFQVPREWERLDYVAINLRPDEPLIVEADNIGNWFGVNAKSLQLYFRTAKNHLLNNSMDVRAKGNYCLDYGLDTSQGSIAIIRNAGNCYMRESSRNISFNENIGPYSFTGSKDLVVVCPSIVNASFQGCENVKLFTRKEATYGTGVTVITRLDSLETSIDGLGC
jgi:hypothetical protein